MSARETPATMETKDDTDTELQDLLSDKTASRFKVARVSISDLAPAGRDRGEVTRLTPTMEHNSYVYDTRNSKSLAQLTREALPRAEHYRDIIQGKHACRPTLEELHEARFLEKAKRRQSTYSILSREHKKGKIIKFGWLEGVYMRCLLNIWGVMLFLRLSWVIGQAGIVQGLVVIITANIVTLITGVSMSAVSTNGRIRAGGIYYMISRSLGPEFGGAIGLMFTLANSVAVSMYIVGFCESIQDVLRMFGTSIIDNSTNDIRLIGSVTLIGILVLAFVGMDWVTRTQMCLLVVLLFSQIDFVIGTILGPKNNVEIAKGFTGYHLEVFKQNLQADYRYFEGVDHDFFSVFSVFFPAVTGIVAGANLSGDLKDPSSAIPKGTLLAIGTTFLSYIAYAIMMGGCMLRDAVGNVTLVMESEGLPRAELYEQLGDCNGTCRYGLHNDNQAMELASVWGPLIYGGCFAATLSSAIASLVGAPRVLQALAKDKLYPNIEFFAKGYGANNDPARGYILVSCIAFGCILIAQLNAIAPLLSNFFLAAYALINFSVFHASISKCPGWRPAFKYYNAWVSLVGTLLCIAVMFLISWWTALVTFFVVITLYLYVSYRKPEVNWGSSTQAQAYNFALKSALDLNRVQEHVKNYRPQLLVLSGLPSSRPPLIDFAHLITKGNSLLMCGHVMKGTHSQRVYEAISQKAYRWFDQHRIKAFISIADEASGSFETAAQSLMQIAGLGKLRPNTVLMGYKSDWQTCPREELDQYFSLIHSALDNYLAVAILRMPYGLDYSSVLQDKDVEMVSSLDKKDAEDKIRRNQSGAQLCGLEENPGLTTETSPDGDTEGDGDGDGEGSADGDVEAPADLSPVEPEASEQVSGKVKLWAELYMNVEGDPLSPAVMKELTHFRRKQEKGFVDVWWLYDDGGLTLLIPHILSTRSQFADCKLRIFSLANRKNQLDRDQRNLAALLSKFRIDYSDLIVIPDITKKAREQTKKEFEKLIENFRPHDENIPEEEEKNYVMESELLVLAEKTNRHMRLRELLMEYSRESTFVVMTLPMPRKGTVSAPLYLAWLELLTRDMPPYLILRGNQTSVLTYYS
ncbi:LOW QUALITY PROTEIN: bumetanide-sensitive sodium-(potassium)-chloride cotransporter-like [Homalodisca vitripennis]|uniref:LOW QUALITY PROTEIN: bumetanide-sensitive sodium-(potassium)-chloride cotransporter-like n=1 Tax=Homalodisca vitripennis TaxID=197043 RepID=UPI001EEA785D|nr:LOW QUALITY PROTEIN: bumetanide-sensitive sodium-(potassium)-chloride cotransporter-like [Homalodisca vitripennis]